MDAPFRLTHFVRPITNVTQSCQTDLTMLPPSIPPQKQSLTNFLFDINSNSDCTSQIHANCLHSLITAYRRVSNVVVTYWVVSTRNQKVLSANWLLKSLLYAVLYKSLFNLPCIGNTSLSENSIYSRYGKSTRWLRIL